MIKQYKLNKIFGPVASISGQIFFVIGLIMTYYSLMGIILALFGAFIGFSSTSTYLDSDLKRIKFSNNSFGFISLGKWIQITSDMKLGIKRSNRIWRTYSRSNRILDISNNHYNIILYTSDGKESILIQKCKNLEMAKSNTAQFNDMLGLR